MTRTTPSQMAPVVKNKWRHQSTPRTARLANDLRKEDF
jgi:hypothetical protein